MKKTLKSLFLGYIFFKVEVENNTKYFLSYQKALSYKRINAVLESNVELQGFNIFILIKDILHFRFVLDARITSPKKYGWRMFYCYFYKPKITHYKPQENAETNAETWGINLNL